MTIYINSGEMMLKGNNSNMKDRINKRKNSILSDISHELRTPLIPILSYSEIIISEIKNYSIDDICSMIEKVNSSGKKLLEATERVLSLYELEYMKNARELIIPANYCMLDERLLMSSITEIRIMNEKSCSIETDIDPSFVKMHEYFLSTLLKETVEKAIFYFRPFRGLRIAGRRIEDNYYLEISELGGEKKQGLKKNNKNIWRNLSANRLGVVLLLTIIEQFGGEITFNKKENLNTVMQVKLPLEKF
jgi:K+-sensing histidine kinase KdpD